MSKPNEPGWNKYQVQPEQADNEVPSHFGAAVEHKNKVPSTVVNTDTSWFDWEGHRARESAARAAAAAYAATIDERVAARNAEAAKKNKGKKPVADPNANPYPWLDRCAVQECRKPVCSEQLFRVENHQGDTLVQGLICPPCQRKIMDNHIKAYEKAKATDRSVKPAIFIVGPDSMKAIYRGTRTGE